jgi:hypothetical protein
MPTIAPAQLHDEITKLLQEVTGVRVCWDAEHPQPMSSRELREADQKFRALFNHHIVAAITSEDAAA